MSQSIVDRQNELDEMCRLCEAPTDDGEGWDGFCGDCADRIELHQIGKAHDKNDCPTCQHGMTFG